MTNITINTYYQYTAIMILILFYGIYIGKIIIQRKKGIQTDQMARGKKGKQLFITEAILKVATYCTAIIKTISILVNTTHSCTPLKIIGLVLCSGGVILFGTTVYTMRDNWRAGIPTNTKTELVTAGIFKISRNPAFLAFDLVYIGILFIFFNLTLFVFSTFSILMLHLQIRQEEIYLQGIFKNEYTKYKQQTKRYIGVNKTSP